MVIETTTPIIIDSPSLCDRRLSRAVKHIFSLSNAPFLDPSEYYSEEELLELVMKPDALQCPLRPSNDPLHYHVQKKIINKFSYKHFAMAGSYLIPPHERYRHRLSNHVFECGICGKLFFTQYYLDHHMDRKHSDTIQHDQICLEKTMCYDNFLSHSLCLDVALQLEPYYGRGSEGLRDQDRIAIRRNYTKKAHQIQCQDTLIAETRENCHRLVQECFRNEAAQYFDTIVCSKLTCPDRLHRLMMLSVVDEVKLHVHEWHEDWAYWTSESQSIGWTGAIIILMLLFWYFYRWVKSSDEAEDMKKKD